MSDSALKRAQGSFALEDVYIREAHAFAVEEFDPSVSVGTLAVQFKIHANKGAEQFYVTREDNVRTNHLRYFIDTGLRVLRPGVDANSPTPISREQLFAEITAVFVVKYVVKDDEPPADELVDAFADNAVHHMWPYWREFVHATTSRLRIPAVVLPMRTAKLRAPDELPPQQ
jgi:hypothetical protein